MNGIKIILVGIGLAFCSLLLGQTTSRPPVLAGIEQIERYLPLLKGKKVGIFCNQTSRFQNGTSLLDSLLALRINVTCLYTPEHGLLGNKDAGEHIDGSNDPKTSLPIISLYGDKKEPTAKDLRNVDLILFDIQDVGVRFYTYISSLEYVIKSCMLHGKSFILLDRPNPHTHYVDGPVLDKKFQSFVGMQAVPVVYGMTIGEYAKMLVGEHWIVRPEYVSPQFKLEVVPCASFYRDIPYVLPIPPSPNLISASAVLLYPSLCFFEGTVISVGRGTDVPFEVYGHPSLSETSFGFTFTPKETTGNKHPLYAHQVCKGERLTPERMSQKIELKWLLKSFHHYAHPQDFFLIDPKSQTYFFDKLAGTDVLRKQILKGENEETIRASWQAGIQRFLPIRKKYLLYPTTQ